jgi:transposase
VDTIKKYELIRPILKHEKTPEQISKEANIPLSTIYYYLKRFKNGGENIESLANKTHAIHSNPKWFTKKDKDKVVRYKLQHPHLSSRQIAESMTKEGILQISYHSVSDILKKRGFSAPFLSTSHLN